MAIMKVALKVHGREKVKINLEEIAGHTEGFTGSEIAELVPAALFTAFAEDAREINTTDILEAAKVVYPMSKSSEAKIKKLRDWAGEKARPATTVKAGEVAKIGRELDL